MQGCEQAMAVMLAKLPTRPFAGMTQIRFKGFGLRHLSPLQDTPRRSLLYDIYFLITMPGRREAWRILSAKNGSFSAVEDNFSGLIGGIFVTVIRS